MDDIVDALVFKLQSKICYHRDAHVEYREMKTMVDKLVKENKKLQDEKMEFLDLINSVIEEKENLQHDYQVIKEGVAPMKEQLETVKKELEKTKHEHVAAKKELEETKHEHVAARNELEEAKHEHVAAKKQLEETKHEHVAAKKELEEAKHEHVAAKKELEEAKQQLAQRNEELEVLRKKFQESEATHTQLHQQKESPPGPEPVHSRRVTRSTHKREMSLQGLLSNDVDGHRPKKRSDQHAGREDDLGGDQTETDQGRGRRVCAASLTGEGSDTNV